MGGGEVAKGPCDGRQGRGKETHKAGSKVLKIHAKRGLNGASSRDDGTTLERPFDDRERVVQRPFHLIQHVVVGPTEDDRRRTDDPRPLDQNQFVVRDPLLYHFVRGAQVRGLKGFFALEVCETGDKGSTCGFGDPFEVFFSAPSHGHGPRFDKFFETEIVDAFGGEDDVGACREDFSYTFENDLRLSLEVV